MPQPSPTTHSPACSRRSPPRRGLTPEHAFDVAWSYDYPDEQTVRRALVAPMGIALLLGPDNEEQFTDGLIDRLAAHRGPDGHYRLQNEFHTLIAHAS